eukprot:s979_g4.t1
MCKYNRAVACFPSLHRRNVRVAIQLCPCAGSRGSRSLESDNIDEGMASTVPRSELKFTKICRHWIAGKCNMGQSCNFAHSDLELREQPNLVATQLCFRFSAKGRCNKGAKCTFAHGREELRRTEKRRDSRRANLEPMRVKLQDGCQDQVAKATSVSLATTPMSVQDLTLMRSYPRNVPRPSVWHRPEAPEMKCEV